MTQDEIVQLAKDAGLRIDVRGTYFFVGFGELSDLLDAAIAKEREACEHDMEVLMNALWKACGDDAEVVNATIESQGELTRARGEQA